MSAKSDVYSPPLARVTLLCSKCKGPLRLVAPIKSEEVARRILTAMHLPTEVPELP
jgi:hypothetical protein